MADTPNFLEALLAEGQQPRSAPPPLCLYFPAPAPPESSAGRGPALQIFGTDYPTPDGTAFRHFIHVRDLAEAHVLGLEHLLAEGGQHVFNLGTGCGSSVQQVVEAFEAVTGHLVPIHLPPRRPGDPPVLVASSAKARRELGWQPRYPELKTILQHAWNWHQRAASHPSKNEPISPLPPASLQAHQAPQGLVSP